jgi:hypothetical protein
LFNVGSIIEAAAILERSFPRTRNSEQQYQPHKHATLESLMLLGSLHSMSGRVADAVVEFKFALLKDPYALEAVEQLAKFGCEESTMLALIDMGLKGVVMYENKDAPAHVNTFIKSKGGNLTPAIEPLFPFWTYAQAHSTLNRNQLPASLEHFNGLSLQFPNHPYLILQKAHIQQELGYILASEKNYQRGPSICTGSLV